MASRSKAVGVSRLSGAVAAAGLTVTGVFHALWVITPWPLATWTDFAQVVLGVPDARVPALLPPMSATVAALLMAAAYLVAARAGLAPAAGPQWLYRTGVWTVAAMLLLRATAGGFVPSGLSLAGAPAVYVRWDLLLYSPLCLLLGGLAALVALRPAGRAGGRPSGNHGQGLPGNP